MSDKITEYGLTKDVRDKLNHMGNYVISPETIGAAKKDHTHPISEVTNLTQELANKSDKTHTHSINEVTNLQKELDNLSTKIDAKVAEAITAVPETINKEFALRHIQVDPVNGDDTSVNGPFKTIKAAILSTPNGAEVNIVLPHGKAQHTYDFTDGEIFVGNRTVQIYGGAASTEENGDYCSTFKCHSKSIDGGVSGLLGYFRLHKGGSICFKYIRIELARVTSDNPVVSDDVTGGLITGPGFVGIFNYGLKSPNLVASGNKSLAVIPMVKSGALNMKGNPSIIFSSTAIQVEKPTDQLIELHGSDGAAIFSQHSCSITSKDGAVVKMANIFSGITYGSHGYATNLLTHESLAKRPA